mgnify:CR=1 FL=1
MIYLVKQNYPRVQFTALPKQADTIGGCQLNTLAKIADALGVKTKRLYEEVEGQEEEA